MLSASFIERIEEGSDKVELEVLADSTTVEIKSSYGSSKASPASLTIDAATKLSAMLERAIRRAKNNEAGL